MEIEEVAAQEPGRDPEGSRSSRDTGLAGWQARKLAFGIGVPAASVNAAAASAMHRPGEMLLRSQRMRRSPKSIRSS